METYWKVDDPYWQKAMPYTMPLYQKESAPAPLAPAALTPAPTRLFGLTRRTGMMTAGMVATGLLLGIAIGFMSSSGTTE